MKIVFIITGLSAGGAEAMLLKILQNLDRETYFPHVISLTEAGEIGPQISALGIPITALEMPRNPLCLPDFLKLVSTLKSLRPDVVHTWMYHADLIGGLAARLAGIKAVAWCIRNSNLNSTYTSISTKIVVRLCALFSQRIPDRIISCSERARKIHLDYGYDQTKMTVIPNGFSLSQFSPDDSKRKAVRRELGIAEDQPLIGLIGRYDPQKNHKGFFEAARLIKRARPDAQFLLAGKCVAPNNPQLMKAAELANVAANTHMLGLRNDTPQLMAALDILVSASSYGEAFPNVLGEAMASGTLCVATDVGDSSYIVGNAGRIVPPGDMHALSEAVLELLALPPEKCTALKRAARARIADKFEISLITRRYEAVYENLAKKPSLRC